LNAYLDTSVLIKSYVAEQDSPVADALILQLSEPIPFTHLHAIEIRTALRVKCGRGEISASELRSALADLQEDIDSGVLDRTAYESPSVFHKAEELSAKYAAVTLARSLDILHVASAVVLGAKEFITFDTRQASLASKAGLTLRPRPTPP